MTAVNILPVEEYLVSVISSEMSATSSGELLRAHAVISRSWLLAQMDKTSTEERERKYRTSFVTDTEITRWYDREDHRNFDVCADDHCQRYQGITRASTQRWRRRCARLRGGAYVRKFICDARYSKCCGGITELFENVWEPVSHPYLRKVIDQQSATPAGFSNDLTDEKNAVKWIRGNPEAFCNTKDRQILSQVLNNYDQETNDFYRWKVIYPQKELSDLVRERTGIDFGRITSLEP